MRLCRQMKKDHGCFISLILFFVFALGEVCSADDIIMPDFRLSADKRFEKVSGNADKVIYQTVRSNHSFDKFFDSLIVEIYKRKPETDMTPSYFGNTYLSRKGFCDNKFEKYIIEDNDDVFFAAWCSQKSQYCEIIKTEYGLDGLVNIKYVHNNLWHFQNNIGSFVEIVRRTHILPYEKTGAELTGNNYFVRL